MLEAQEETVSAATTQGEPVDPQGIAGEAANTGDVDAVAVAKPVAESTEPEEQIQVVELNDHYPQGQRETNKLVVFAQGMIGPGGAYHLYKVWWPSKDGGPGQTVEIPFQCGPMPEGMNGLTQEVLLSIVKHRLECFQAGPFACDENKSALEFVVAALESLHDRTKDRQDRKVEGKLEA